MSTAINDTNTQYAAAVQGCRDIFLKKTADYGTSWRVYRTISVTDQIYIKAWRVRTIQEKGQQKVGAVGDDIASEFRGIFNYAIIGLIQLALPADEPFDLPVEEVANLYDTQVAAAQQLLQAKNHDYGEVWRNMWQESFTDLILSKLLRIQQMIANEGKTVASEGIEANYYDIMNYAVFALILMQEGKH